MQTPDDGVNKAPISDTKENHMEISSNNPVSNQEQGLERTSKVSEIKRDQEKAPGQSSAQTDFGEAARLIEEGLNKVGADQDLSKSYEVYIHNSVVTLARDERYEEALSLLDSALALLPDSRVLQQDRSKVLTASGRQ